MVSRYHSPGSSRKLSGVEQEERRRAERSLDGVVAVGVVVPGRLPHDDRRAGDAPHRREPVGERQHRLEVDAPLVGQGGQVGEVRVVDGEAGRGQRDVTACQLDPRTLCRDSVDVELPAVESGADVGPVDPRGGVVGLPAGDGPGAAQHGRGSARRLPGHGVPVPAGVGGVEPQRRGQPVGPVQEQDGDVAVRLGRRVTRPSLCLLQGRQRPVRTGRALVVGALGSGGRDHDRVARPGGFRRDRGRCRLCGTGDGRTCVPFFRYGIRRGRPASNGGTHLGARR